MNKHITDACTNYIINSRNPEYGIFIDGPWGCGKTFFINRLVDNLITTDGTVEPIVNESDIAVISLYGIKNVAEISGKIFLETHKKIDTKWVGRFAKGADAASKLIFNVDTTTTMQMLFREWFESNTRKIIVVDDLERSDIPINEVLGFFFEAIIKYDARVIFIGNENEVLSKYNDFKRIKEKVIGETFTLVAEADEAIDSFLNEIVFDNINRGYLKAEVLNVIRTLEIDNMRNVRQAFIHALRLIEAVINCNVYKECEQENQDYTKEDYIIDIIKTYMILYLQKARGEFLVEETQNREQQGIKESEAISMTIGTYQNNGWSQKKYIDEARKKEAEEKDSYYHLSGKTPTGFIALYMQIENGYSLWGDYLIRSQIDYNILEEAIRVDSKQFSSYEEKGTSLVKLIRESYDMSDNEFRKTYDKFINELSEGVYKAPGELLHAFSLCLRLQEHGVIIKKSGELLDYFDDIIEVVADYDEFSRNETLDSRFGSLGYSYDTNLNEGDGKTFDIRLRAKVYEKHQLALKIKFLKIFENTNDDEQFDIWVRLIHPFTSGESNEYYKQPIFSWLKANDIVELLVTKSFISQLEFLTALNDRYKRRAENKDLRETHMKDLPVLEEMRKLYIEYLGKIKKEDISLMRTKLVLKKIDELWDDLSRMATSDNASSE